jgi:4-hydroxybenzoate polyprenyltransferase
VAFLSRKNRVILVKLLALLSIVRWPNVLFTSLAQYVAALFVFNPDRGWLDILHDSKLHLIVFATAFILAAGFIINSFYDVEKDIVNRPHKTLFDRVVSKAFCLNTYLVFNFIGLIFSALGSARILLFFSIFSFGLWFYSHKLQKIPVVREFSAALLSVAAFFSIGFHYEYVNRVIVLYAFIFLQMLFIRELIKDFRHYVGDEVVGNKTILMVLGKQRSQVLFLAMLTLLACWMLVFKKITYSYFVEIYLVTMLVMMLLSALSLFYIKPNGSAWAHRIWKLMLALNIIYLILFRSEFFPF